MRRWRPFLPLGTSWTDVPSSCNWNINYLSSSLCWKVYCTFHLRCPCLFRLHDLYCLARMPLLQTELSFAQLSCCTCQGGTESVGCSWGISCPQWWIQYASLLSDFHVGCHSSSGKRRKGSTLWRPHMWLAVLPTSVQRRFECIAPVPHTPGLPCVVRSRKLLLWRTPLYWTACTTVDWTECLFWMRKNQVLGCTPLQEGIDPPSGPGQSFQSAGRVSEGHRQWCKQYHCN